jgi:PEP-CTERM motif
MRNISPQCVVVKKQIWYSSLSHASRLMGQVLSCGFLITALPSGLWAETLQYDDGSYEISGALHGEAVRFNVPSIGSPYKVESVSVFIENSLTNQSINIKLWNDNGGQVASAIGSLLYQQGGTVSNLQWYSFDVSSANVVIPANSSFFAGWTSDDWLTRRADTTTVQDRTFYNVFGSGWSGPDDFGGPNENAPIRVNVTVIPEPSTILLVAMGGLAVLGVRSGRSGHSKSQ